MSRPTPLLLALCALGALLSTSHAQYRMRSFSSFSPMSSSFGGFQQIGRPELTSFRRSYPIEQPDRTERELPVEKPQILEGERGPTVAGRRAIIKRGIAYAPADAPEHIKRSIWAINRIVGRRYKWGGGHGSFIDDGYDCSGTVSYALHHAGLLDSPMASSELTRFGNRGRGRWITVYAKSGHVFAVIAGLRLDTTDFRVGGDVGPRWHYDGRDTSAFESRHAAGA